MESVSVDTVGKFNGCVSGPRRALPSIWSVHGDTSVRGDAATARTPGRFLERHRKRSRKNIRSEFERILGVFVVICELVETYWAPSSDGTALLHFSEEQRIVRVGRVYEVAKPVGRPQMSFSVVFVQKARPRTAWRWRRRRRKIYSTSTEKLIG